MRKGIIVEVSAADRARLGSGRGRPEQPAEARLAGADHPADGGRLRHGARSCGGPASRKTVRLALAGALHARGRGRAAARQDPALAHPAARAGGRSTRVVALTLADPPGEATHWTARAWPRRPGISASSVQRIWRAHGLQPHRVRDASSCPTTRRSPPSCSDIVGLYVDPPAHAVVLSVDEKSQIQALDRTQPGLPMKKGRAAP